MQKTLRPRTNVIVLIVAARAVLVIYAGEVLPGWILFYCSFAVVRALMTLPAARKLQQSGTI